MKRRSGLMILVFAVLLAGLPFAVAMAQGASGAGGTLPPNQTFLNAVAFEKDMQACMAETGPIEMDDLYFSALELMAVNSDMQKLYDGLRNWVDCRQVELFNQPVCSPEKTFVKPFFTEGKGDHEWSILGLDGKSLSQNKKKEIYTYASTTVDAQLKNLKDDCVGDAFFNLISLGETAFSGSDFAKDVCQLLPNRFPYGDDCPTELSAFLKALQTGDTSYCAQIKNDKAQNPCKLFATRDYNICKTRPFSGDPTADMSKCRSLLTAFKVIRGLPVETWERIPADAGPLAMIAGYSSNSGYCDSVFQEQVRAEYCRGKFISKMVPASSAVSADQAWDAMRTKIENPKTTSE